MGAVGRSPGQTRVRTAGEHKRSNLAAVRRAARRGFIARIVAIDGDQVTLSIEELGDTPIQVGQRIGAIHLERRKP